MADSPESTPSGRGFLIPLDIILKARKEGYGLSRLQEMVRLSARCTHPEGNRRFEDVVFMVVGKRVVSFIKLAPEVPQQKHDVAEPEVIYQSYYRCNTCHDTRKVQVFDPCDYCDGTGCNRCDDGLVPASIPCPVCEQRARLYPVVKGR